MNLDAEFSWAAPVLDPARQEELLLCVSLDRVFVEGLLSEHCSHVAGRCIVLVLELVLFMMGDKSEAGHPIRLLVNVGSCAS